MAKPLVVTRGIPELEEDAGAGNTETYAPESTRKFPEERVPLRYRREEEELTKEARTFLPADQLVFWPGAGLLAFLGLSPCVRWNQQVEEAGDRDPWWQ